MADPKHIEWFREGAESWNARRQNTRRKKEFFVPNLEGANLSKEIPNPTDSTSEVQKPSHERIFLGDAILRRANFRELQLPDADLSFTQAQEAIFNLTNLKGAELDGGDFRGANFQAANLRGASLVGVNLTEANLRSVRLQDAFCGGANMTRSNLGNARLARANLTGTNLTSADLTVADLTGADLSNAVLSEATLVRTNVRNANLKSATLAGVVAPGTQLWRAVLYEQKETTKEGPQGLPSSISSVAQLLEICSKLIGHNATNSRETVRKQENVLYFRGHDLSHWELSPSVTRLPSQGEPDVRGKEGAMLTDLVSRRPEEFSRVTSALSQWVLAQQYRLRTRLLDITRNPLVALFFACDDVNHRNEDGALHLFVVPNELVKPFNSDSISVVANFAKLPPDEQDFLLGKSLNTTGDVRGKIRKYSNALVRLYHHIGTEKPIFKERIDPRDLYRIFVVEPEQSFERLRAQSGAFLVSAFHQRFEPEEVMRVNPGVPLYDHYRFSVSADRKESILRDLSLLNVTKETLFPGLDEATQAVMRDHAA